MNYEAVTLKYAVDPAHDSPTPMEDFHGKVARLMMDALGARLQWHAEREIVSCWFFEELFLEEEETSGWSEDTMWFGFTQHCAGIGQHWFSTIMALERWNLATFFTKHGYTLLQTPQAPQLHDVDWVYVPIKEGQELVAFWGDGTLTERYRGPYPIWASRDMKRTDLSQEDLERAQALASARRCGCSLCQQRASFERVGGEDAEARQRAEALIAGWVEGIKTPHESLIIDVDLDKARLGTWQHREFASGKHTEFGFSPSSQRLFAYLYKTRALTVWDIKQGTKLDEVPLDGRLQSWCWVDEDTLWLVAQPCVWQWQVGSGQLELIFKPIPDELYGAIDLGEGLLVAKDPCEGEAAEVIDVRRRDSVLSVRYVDDFEPPAVWTILKELTLPFDHVAVMHDDYTEKVEFVFVPSLDIHPAHIPWTPTTLALNQYGVLTLSCQDVWLVQAGQAPTRVGVAQPQGDIDTFCVLSPDKTRLMTLHTLTPEGEDGPSFGCVVAWGLDGSTPSLHGWSVFPWAWRSCEDPLDFVRLSPCARRYVWSRPDGFEVCTLC